MYTSCMLSAQEVQKRVLDPLELELEMIVNLHVGAGVLCKSQTIS